MRFQSSSDPQAGCDEVHHQPAYSGFGFNPHPTRRPDATLAHRADAPDVHVSILIRPEGRMRRHGATRIAGFNPHPAGGRHDDRGRLHTRRCVSILIRPEGRMRRAAVATAATRIAGFNPHPTRRPDATVAVGVVVDVGRFNPHPTRRPDATPRAGPLPGRFLVSILIRPEGRMRLGVVRLTSIS